MSLREKGESWEQCLRRLKKEKVHKPEKREFDIKRQKIARREKLERAKVKRLDDEIAKKRSSYEKCKSEFDIIKADPVFQNFEQQLNKAIDSKNHLQSHYKAQQDLKDKSAMLRKVLGQYKDIESLEAEIKKEEMYISQGQYKTIAEERGAIKKISKLKKLRMTALDYADNEANIKAAMQDKQFQSDLNYSKREFDQLKTVKDEKKQKDEARKDSRDKMNKVWKEIQDLYDKKKEILEKAKEYNEDANKVGNQYRTVEKKYMDFQQKLQRAEQEAAKERREKQRKERAAEESKLQEQAFKLAGAPRAFVDTSDRQQRGPRGRNTPKESPNNQDQSPAGEEKPDNEKPAPRPKRKKDKKDEKKDEESTMVEKIVPYLQDIERMESLKGYLQSLMPRSPTNGQQRTNGAQQQQRGKKPRKRKQKGQLKHYLNWVQAFADAGCSTLLPNRREKLEECFEGVCKKLDEFREKSDAAMAKRTVSTSAAEADKAQQEQEAEAPPTKAEPASEVRPDTAAEQAAA